MQTIYEYDDFGPELNKTGYFEEDLKKILDGKNTVDEKILVIFDEIQECNDALNSLKYFNESANEYHICAAGSLSDICANSGVFWGEE